MGFVSLQEDVEEALRLANLVAERLPLGQISPSVADNIIKSVLKRCAYITTSMEEIKKLHSDLSRDTRNRIYTLRSERDDALKKVSELQLMLRNALNSREMRKELLQNRIVPSEQTKKHAKKTQRKKKARPR